MNTHTALRRAGRVEYAVLRAPLRIVDEQLVHRFLAQDSVARRTFEQALDNLDDAADRWLRGPDRRDESPVAEAAPTQDAPTTDTDDTDAATSESSGEAAEPVEEEQIEHLTDELLEEQESETFAGELAEDDELRRVQAELNAKRLVEEQRDQQG